MNDEPKILPIARLTGVIENPGEYTPCSLVFVLQTEQEQTIHLNYEMLMQAVQFAQDQGVIAPLPVQWWAQAAVP